MTHPGSRRLLAPLVIRLALAVLILGGCSVEQSVDYALPEATEQPAGQMADYSETRNAYFGDLHVHTKYSFDAYIFGVTAGPDDAYRYARGEAIKHPLGFDMRLREPLDFYAVTDHAMFLGMVAAFADTSTEASHDPIAGVLHNINARLCFFLITNNSGV